MNVVTGGYWSSSVYELDPTYVYLADLSATSLSNDANTTPHFPVNLLHLNVWPVRNGSR